MISFQEIHNALFGGGQQSQPQPVAQSQPKPQQSFLGGISKFAGNVGNYLKQDFLRAPQIQTINRVASIPKMDLAKNVKNPILRFGAEAGQSIINSPINTAQGLQGFGTDISKVATGKPVRFQDVLYHGAQAADLPLNLFTGGGTGAVGKTVLKQGFKNVLKEGAITGGRIGTGFGLQQGALSGKDINNPLDYATNLGINTVIGGTLGAGIGAGGGAVGYGAKKLVNRAQNTIQERQLETFSNGMRDMTPRFVEDPAIKPYKKAFTIDSDSARELANAITEVDKGNIGNGDVFATFERMTNRYLPQFSDLPTPDKAKIWDYLLARRYNLPTDNPVPPQLKDLDKAIFEVAGFHVKQGGFIGIPDNAPKENPFKPPLSDTEAQLKKLVEAPGIGEGGKPNPLKGTYKLQTVKTNEVGFGASPDSTESVNSALKAIQEGKKLPPITVKQTMFNDAKFGNQYEVIDGNHRLLAYQRAGIKDIPILVKQSDSGSKILNPQDFFNPSQPKVTPSLSEVGGKAGGNVPPSGNVADDLLKALDEAKAIRGQQDIGYSAERSQRFGEFSTALQPGGGKEGAKAAISKLKGELPKQQFEPLKLTPDVENQLYDTIAGAKHLQPGEQASAIGGLDSMIGGVTPTETQIKALGQVFGKDFTSALNSKLSLSDKLSKNVSDILNVPRSVQSAGDFSAPLRQGAVLAPTHPKEFAKAFKNMFGYAFSEKKFMNRGKEILQHPNYPKAKFANLSLTTPNAGLNQREEAFMSNLAERIPGLGGLVKTSDRAYTGFLNDLRFGTFNSLLKNGEKLGKGDDAKYLRDLAGFINNATGRGQLPGKVEQAAPLLNAGFFSPRLLASRLALLNPGYYTPSKKLGGGLDPTVRKEAAKTVTAFVATGLTILGLAKLAGADVETDPTSADFGQMKFGNTRYDIWAGFRPYVNFIARLGLGYEKSTRTGEKKYYGEGYPPKTKWDALIRFGETKASPIASFAIDALKGQDFEYNKFDLTNTDPFVNPVIKRLMPLIMGDIKEAWENTDLGPIPAIPGIFGVGQASYKPTGAGIGTKIKSKPSNYRY